jgi:hypothetical protein
MSAVIAPAFGNPTAVRTAEIGNAAYDRALKLGYGRVVAQSLARKAKAEATDWETPTEVAMRMVPPKSHSATVRGRGPYGGSAA